MTAIYNGLRVQYHVNKDAARTFYPWTNLVDKGEWSERSFIGWDAEAHGDNTDEVFFYLVPDPLSKPPIVSFYMGRTGDPDQDQLMAEVMWVGDGP